MAVLSVAVLSVAVVPLDVDIHDHPHRPSGKLDRSFRIQKLEEERPEPSSTIRHETINVSEERTIDWRRSKNQFVRFGCDFVKPTVP